METYLEFLRSKIVLAKESGFELDPGEVNPGLKPHQRDAVVWALRGGRRALFESFGLGKTVQEIEFCHQAVRHDGGRALIVLPLGVRQEFARDAQKILGYPAPVYIKLGKKDGGDGLFGGDGPDGGMCFYNANSYVGVKPARTPERGAGAADSGGAPIYYNTTYPYGGAGGGAGYGGGGGAIEGYRSYASDYYAVGNGGQGGAGCVRIERIR